MSLQNWKWKCSVRSLITSYHKNLTLSYHMKVKLRCWGGLLCGIMHHITLVVALCACVPGRSLLAVSSRTLALGMCACALAHGIVSSRALARGILCTRTPACSRLYVASCACAAVTTQHCCCTNCTSCHMQTIYVEQWNHRVFVMISYNNIMHAHIDKTEFWCFPWSFLVDILST